MAQCATEVQNPRQDEDVRAAPMAEGSWWYLNSIRFPGLVTVVKRYIPARADTYQILNLTLL